MTAIFICKDCGKQFEVSHGEAQWLMDHNLEMPKRCKECRTKRKAAKEAARAAKEAKKQC